MWADHFRWSGDGTQVIGRIDTGRASVDALRMNNPAIVFARAFWVKYGLHPPKLQSEA